MKTDQDYLAAEGECAKALGWTDLRIVPMYGRYKWWEGRAPDGAYGVPVPNWCRDSEHLVRLICDHKIGPRQTETQVIVDDYDVTVEISDHKNTIAALRYACVLAATEKAKRSRSSSREEENLD